MDKKVEAIIIATDVKGRNKVRFCESFKRRYYLLTKQQFVIHDAILMPEKMTKEEAVDFVLANKDQLRHSDSLAIVEKTKLRFKPKQLSLKAILNRKKVTLTTDQAMSIIESVS